MAVKPTATLNTRIPVELNDRLEAYIKVSEETKVDIIRKALEEYLSKNA